MADEQPRTSNPVPVSQEDGPLLVNLHILSPTDGVGNLRFPGLPAATTIRELKAKIRETLEARPADEDQRLIHRGRVLARDTDTLKDVFGEQEVCCYGYKSTSSQRDSN